MHMNMKLMALVALPLLARAEAALDPVAYLDWDATTKTFVAKECSSYTVVTAGMSELANGWFVVKGDISRGQLKIKGNVSLILTDGSTLSVTGGGYGEYAGVHVGETDGLTIYGQEAGTGHLHSTVGGKAAGIGGNIRESCGTVTINGGRITTNRIGLSRAEGYYYVDAVVVTGGLFAEKVGESYCIEHYGFMPNLDSETSAAYPWTVLPISCEVTVGELKNMSAAWTSGDGSVTNAIEGTSFKAMTGETVTVLVSPKDPNCFLYGGEESYTFVVSGEDVNLTGKFASAALYLDANGEPQTRSDYTIITESATTLGDGKWYVVNSTVSCRTISVSGAAKLILGNGAVLAVSEGIEIESGASLTIYGQSGDAGFLDAQGGEGEPGIGGAGAVTIVGGTVTATGGDGVPGIACGGKVVICGGSVGADVRDAQNASGAALYRVTVEGLGTAAPTFADLPSGYGTAGISPIDGAVWPWMPNGSYGFKVNGETYAVTVKGQPVVATKAQWTIGAGVTAAWVDGVLTIAGKGTIDDFTSAIDVPWQGLTVTNVTIPTGVTLGRNLFAGFADNATVNGADPVALMRQAAGDILVGGLAPAEAKALEIDGGRVRLTVEVESSADLKTWKSAKMVDISVPVEGEKGFYILKSK